MLKREYDLFEKLPGGDVWRCTVQGIEKAIAKLEELARLSGNEHYAIYLPTKEIVARVNVKRSEAK